jgi:dTDP-glucose 4,6-dehydratase
LARVVVTGGAGFLGSHLVDVLLARGDEIVAVDDLSTGSLDNLDAASGCDRFTFARADVSKELPVDGSVDMVLHFASPASPPRYLARPIETLDVGSSGTRHALELARAHDARFVLASTSEVYGDPLVHPQPETYWGNVSSTGPRAVYDEAKRFAEALTAAYHQTFGVRAGIVRIFNTYGPRLAPEDGRVVSNLLVQAMRGEPLTVYGEGTQTRSFCYVDDEIRGIVALADSEVTEPVNIGYPGELTIVELAQLVAEIAGCAFEVTFDALPVDDPARRCPDISRARELLQWEPTVEPRRGLELTYEWYRGRGGR